MAEITPEMIKQTYLMAKKIYNNDIDKNSGIRALHNICGINENSASIYIENFKRMMSGQQYGRIMKADDTQYFLIQILNDYGEKTFRKALYAVKQHIEYIKSIHKPSNVEELYKTLLKKYNISSDILSSENIIDTTAVEDADEIEENRTQAEPPQKFSYEKDLQTALIRQVESLFPEYQIYGENLDGVEYQIEGKKIDLLLENKSKNELVAIELKKGTADFKVFGQISMYLGLLKKEFSDKLIKGIIIAGEIDDSLKYAVVTNSNIKLMVYEMALNLMDIV